MASDATLLNTAPVTPAHKFAWRALRGFVYGNPDSSPEHLRTSARNDQENRHLSSPTRSSPSKKRVSMPAITTTSASNAQQAPSPVKKRKRESLQVSMPQQVLSPTKSILRTPGAAPTPRAKSLRDVNVTFKSVSPEGRVDGGMGMVPKMRMMTVPGLGNGVQVGEVEDLEKQVDELWEEMERSLLEKEESEKSQSASPPVVEGSHGKLQVGKRRSKAAAKEEVKKVEAVAILQDKPISEPAQVGHEDYARRTEREVKRLLRQHKKLRDYAQRADEQNVALQAMVAHLQKENIRLKSRLEKAEATTGDKVSADEGISKRGPSIDSNSKSEEKRQENNEALSRPRTIQNNHTEEKKRKVSKTKEDHDSFERSLRRSVEKFHIHEDDAPIYKQRKATDQAKSNTNRELLSEKNRAATISALPSSLSGQSKTSHPEANEVPTRGSNSLRGAKDTKSSNTTKPVRATQPSPFSLTTLAARLEPTPAPAPRATTTVAPSFSTTNVRPQAPLPSTNGLNMSPTRVAAARARLQAKRLASNSILHTNDMATSSFVAVLHPRAPASPGTGRGDSQRSQHHDVAGQLTSREGHLTSLMLQEALAEAEEGAGFVCGDGGGAIGGGGGGAGGRARAVAGSNGGGAESRHVPKHDAAALGDPVLEESELDWAKM